MDEAGGDDDEEKSKDGSIAVKQGSAEAVGDIEKDKFMLFVNHALQA